MTPTHQQIRQIKKIVCDYKYISVDRLIEKNPLTGKNYRTGSVKEARQIISYLLKRYTKMSLQDIADIFRQDHATTSHSFKKITELMESDRRFRHEIENIQEKTINILTSPIEIMPTYSELEQKIEELKDVIFIKQGMIDYLNENIQNLSLQNIALKRNLKRLTYKK